MVTPERAVKLEKGAPLIYRENGKRALFSYISYDRLPSKTYGPTAWIYVDFPQEDGRIMPGGFGYPCQSFEEAA